MMIKKIVSISLFSGLILMGVLLVMGLFMPTSVLEKLSAKKADKNTQVVALDANGKPIAGATVQTNADGSKTVTTQSSTTAPAASTTTSGASTPAAATKATTATVAAKPATVAPTPTPAPTPAPAAPACGASGGSCTAAQVAAHNSAGNCWVIYAGSYYIITNYVNRHNGGSGAFTGSTCGHDITAYMNGSTSAGTSVGAHPHSAGAYGTLASYKIGAVK